MNASEAGFLGAGVGLVVGVADYLIAGALAAKKLNAARAEAEPQDKDDLERRLASFRRLLFVSTVIVFPFIGYFIGRKFGT